MYSLPDPECQPLLSKSCTAIIINLIQQEGDGGGGGGRVTENVYFFLFFFPAVTPVRSRENKYFLQSLIRAKYLMNISQPPGEVW